MPIFTATFERTAQDLRYAARFLRRSPGFTTVALISLGLGVGANAAVFTVTDRLLLRPPAHVRDNGTLQRLYFSRTIAGRAPRVTSSISWTELFALQEHAPLFRNIAAYTPPWPERLARDLDAGRAKVSLVTGNFLSVLGVVPRLGRLIAPDDDRDGITESAAVISFAFWHRHFGGDPAVLGKPLSFRDSRAIVVGVAPPGFTGLELDAADVWLPLAPAKSTKDGARWREEVSYASQAVIRFDTDVSHGAAVGQMRAALSMAKDARGHAPGVTQSLLGPVLRGRGPGDARMEETVANRLALASLLLLLAACANVANLLFVRAIARKREIAFRIAIGVSRKRLVIQLMLEGLLIGMLGSVVAVAAAYAGGQLMRRLLFPDHSWIDSPVDGRVLVFAIACATITALAAALIPAVRMSRPDLLDALRSGTRAAERRGSRLRAGLLSVQTALSVMLLVGAALFSRSLERATTFDIGFDRDSLVRVRLDYETGGTQSASTVAALYNEIAARLSGVPGVARVGVGSAAPLSGYGVTSLSVPGVDTARTPDVKYTALYSADENFIPAAGIRVTRGRAFSMADRRGAERVAIINETLAARLWPGESAIGKCIRLVADTLPCLQVVGTITNFRTMSLREDPSNVTLIPIAQVPGLGLDRLATPGGLVVRTKGDPADLVPLVRTVVRQARSDLTSLNVEPVGRSLEREMRPWRLGTSMFGLLAGLTLLIAAVGLSGTVAFTVAQRTPEIGIRSALGARRAHLGRVVLVDATRSVVVGLLLGVVGAVLASSLVSALLFETSGRDPLSYAFAILALLGAAIIAAAIPAWRATHIDPVAALRSE